MGGRRGITILEMMIVVMLVSVLAGLTYPSVTSGLDALRLRSAANGAAALLGQAMARVEKTQRPAELVVDRKEGLLQLIDRAGGFRREMKLEPGIAIEAVLPPLPGAGEETARSLVLVPGEPFPGVGIVFGNRRRQRRIVRIDPLTATAVVEAAPESVSEEGTR
ncbi:MAG: prepilin-type N-terminal cleavage/methylation domain-containing protein [Bryobacteraceae bacterium]|jgi:prepilin-type N-terminal cleavage/methylation domain-containing protein